MRDAFLETIHQFFADAAKFGLKAGHAPRGECHGHQSPVSSVGRRVFGEHRRHVRPRIGVDLFEPSAELGRGLRPGTTELGRERRRVVEDALDVLVTRHGKDPFVAAPKQVAVELEDRGLVAHLSVVRVGALNHVVIGGVEGNGVGHRAIHSSRIAWK